MTIAIMQPYVFPYIGYFQLIHAVDKFVFYDDVTFIKQGWIARNRLLVNGKPFLFSIPLVSPSSYQKIKNTPIHQQQYQKWLQKFLKTLHQSYNKAPYHERVMPMLQEILDRDYNCIDELAKQSVLSISLYLNTSAEFVTTSEIYNNSHLKAQERVLDICKKEQATRYVNAIGGQELYKQEDFLKEDIKLYFLQPQLKTYHQHSGEFVPWLSIIDMLMFNSVEDIQKEHLPSYQLI